MMSQNDPCGGVNFAADDVMTIDDFGDESGDGTNLNEDKLVVREDVGDEVLVAARGDGGDFCSNIQYVSSMCMVCSFHRLNRRIKRYGLSVGRGGRGVYLQWVLVSFV